MQLSWIGASAAALIALPTLAAPDATAAAGPSAAVVASPPRSRQAPPIVEHYVDLNSASTRELMTLPGIGAAEASRIVANRPYRTKTELVTKDVLPLGPFLSLKRLVVATPATAPKGKS